MSFGWPLALLGLLLVPLAVAGYWLAQRRRMRYAARFTNLDLLANVVERSPGWRRHVPPALVLLALAALLVSLARPETAVSVPREQATIMLTMDTSGSMAATDVEPTRMVAARAAAHSFVDDLPEKFRVGVVSFAGAAQLMAPPTHERPLTSRAIDSLEAFGGTALGDALGLSLAAGRDEEAERSPRTDGDEQPPLVILLLSDGKNTAGRLQPLAAASEAQRLGVPIFAVALGTPQGTVRVQDEYGVEQIVAVPPDPATLRQIAGRTGGEFFAAPDEESLSRVYREIGSRVGYVKEKREITFVFAAAGTLLLLAGGTLSALWFNRIP